MDKLHRAFHHRLNQLRVQIATLKFQRDQLVGDLSYNRRKVMGFDQAHKAVERLNERIAHHEREIKCLEDHWDVD